MNKTIETLGGIAKEETLNCIDHKIIPNSLVLESCEPFPGYHSNVPEQASPNMIFLITTENYSYEKILRINSQVKKIFSYPFDACTGKICIYNDSYNCIRVKDLENFECIEELQSCFMDAGIKFFRKKKISAPAIIQLKKHFLIEQIDEFFYKDLEDKNMHYIHLPVQLSWKMFEQITYSVKNNLIKNDFDAALATIYLKEPLDAVRVYTKDMDIDRLNEIRDRYITDINRIFKF